MPLQPSNRFVGERGIGVFPKSVRLRKRFEFLRLLNSPHKFATRGFLVVWLENGGSQARLGATVSKKVGCAVIRNRIKRYIRESFRQMRLLLPGVDINVVARRDSATMDFRAVQRELEKAFRHIGTSPCSSAVRSS
ncbi:MAG: ribonuclease P protein component [Oryzomonas sp.]